MTLSKNYLKNIYDPIQKPFTNYPKNLINFIIKKNTIKDNSRVLDVCCGRGEFLNEFILNGLEGHGVDIDDICLKYFPKIKYHQADLSKDPFPFEDNFFDVIFSKSVIEHFYYPESIIQESYRVLKPGGKIITLTPSWIHNKDSFYDDFTHKQPFNKTSIYDLHKIFQFKEIKADYFIQLPILWNENLFSKLMKFISFLVRVLVPNILKKRFKFVFFSKEIMLICTAKK